jgi:hypothetical protein
MSPDATTGEAGRFSQLEREGRLSPPAKVVHLQAHHPVLVMESTSSRLGLHLQDPSQVTYLFDWT